MMGWVLDILTDVLSDSLDERLGKRKHGGTLPNRGEETREAPSSTPKLAGGGWAQHYRRCTNRACPREGWDVIETVCRGCDRPTVAPS
jgi:hypothetical protein